MATRGKPDGTVTVAIWGKIVGAALGLALGGPLGALIGAALGHAFDYYVAGDRRSRPKARRQAPWAKPQVEPPPVFADPAETRRIAFATAVIALGAKLAKADGLVTRDEVQAFKRIFRVADREVGGVAQIYDRAKRTAEGFEPYARQIVALFGRDPILLEELLLGLFEVARADGELNRAEVDFLRRVAAIFGFDLGAFEQIHARYAATARNLHGADDAYAVLGVPRSASDDEIKQSYRRLVREHHPDQLVAKDSPADLVAQANKRLAAINAAYDRIAQERRLR